MSRTTTRPEHRVRRQILEKLITATDHRHPAPVAGFDALLPVHSALDALAVELVQAGFEEKPAPRTCKSCGAPERTTDLGGDPDHRVTYSNISPNLGICADCINHELSQLHQ